MEIESFEVRKLHGYKSYNIQFQDNTLILVGENGTGKTTVLRMLYYVLSDKMQELDQIEFESITLTINRKKYTFEKNNLFVFSKYDRQDNLFRSFPPAFKKSYQGLIRDYSPDSPIFLHKLKVICSMFGAPYEYFVEKIHLGHKILNEEYFETFKKIQKLLSKTSILYLPTYRRIEQELDTIFKNNDEHDEHDEFIRRRLFRSRRRALRKQTLYTELVEFGMSDVDDAIKRNLEELKEFAREKLNSLTQGYLGDVVGHNYDELDFSKIQKVTNETIDHTLSRIDESILSTQNKEELDKIIKSVNDDQEPDEHTKIVCHYFSKLMDFQNELKEKEERFRSFCDVCNKYMKDKKLSYDSSNFSFLILSTHTTKYTSKIQLEQLSSGEKQVVSLFCHLYLRNHNYLVMIDEPELSLSVPWQRQFLVDIKNCDFCSGLIAVTHSPFVYDNELDEYTYGLNEFIREK